MELLTIIILPCNYNYKYQLIIIDNYVNIFNIRKLQEFTKIREDTFHAARAIIVKLAPAEAALAPLPFFL